MEITGAGYHDSNTQVYWIPQGIDNATQSALTFFFFFFPNKVNQRISFTSLIFEDVDKGGDSYYNICYKSRL